MKYIHPSIWLEKICANTSWVGVTVWHAFAYHRLRGKWPNFLHPKDLSEHILSSMNKRSFLKYADFADKVKVRDYIKSKGLEDILLEIYGVWKNPKDIDFDILPNKFALKPNNGSGGHFFCKDKSKIDKATVIKNLQEGLDLVKDDITFRFERHYGKIEPRIYCEELIDTGTDSWPIDYKFMCVKGQIADCLIVSSRDNKGNHYCIRMNSEWQILPYTKKEFLSKEIIAKPKHWEEMIRIAKILSEDFECVRVDLYEYKDKVYFGELTFSPAGGYLYSYNDHGINEIGKLFDRKKNH